MAETKLSDLIIPSIFTSYLLEQTTQRSPMFRSGLVSLNPLLQERFSNGGQVVTLPHGQAVPDTAANTSSDEPGQVAVPLKLTASSQRAVRLDRNQGWKVMDLAKMLSGYDPIGSLIRTLNGEQGGLLQYWINRQQDSMLSILRGITAWNLANGGDMIATIGATGTAGTHVPTAADRISPEALVQLELTMGDSPLSLPVLVCHPVVGGQIKLQNLTRNVVSGQNFSADQSLALQQLQWSAYLQKLVIVDERCPVAADGTNAFMYTSYLCGLGLFGYAEMVPAVPLENERKPAEGNGAGADEVWSRRAYCLHPNGFSWNGTMAGDTPTEAELQTATSFVRVMQRKNVPLGILRTNG